MQARAAFFRYMRLAGLILTMALGAGCASARTATPRCHMSGGTGQWLQGSYAAWEQVRTRQLGLPEASPPDLVVFDRWCAYELSTGRSGTIRVAAGTDTLVGEGRPHDGTIRLTNGLTRPVRAEAFAALLPGDSATVLVIALEDVWREDPDYRTSTEDWRALLRRSFVHEMTHARQLPTWTPMLRIAATRAGLADFDDDVIQQVFDTVPGFGRAIGEETALLYEAAAHPSRERQRALATQAIQRMQMRRARVYGGEDAPWARVEQILLDIEGAAQWAVWAHVGNSTRLRVDERTSIVRGSGHYWSQEQGLALYLLLDALVPDWPRQMFSANPPSSLDLLVAALAP